MADSCFLPNTFVQFAWDSTSLGYLKVCPRLYQYHMIEGWQSREESVHLRFGIELHRAMQNYDLEIAAGIKHDDALHDVVRELLLSCRDWDPDHKTKRPPNLIRAVIWYLDQFKDDPAKTYIRSDGKPAVEQSFRFELGFGPQAGSHAGNEEPFPAPIPYLLCGHLDKVVTYNGDLFAKDYKTTYSFYGKVWEPDNQMTLYTLASKIVLEAPIRGVMIDMFKITEDGAEFKREFTHRTEDQLQEWLGDLRYWLTLAEQYAVNNYWPMNDLSCSMYGGCRFRNVCSKSPGVRERFLEADFVKLPPEKRWNPLATRE